MSGLLAADEPRPWVVERAAGSSPFVLTCDHAGCRLPRALGDLGLAEAERRRHIGWDIGALGLARELSARLDAVLVWQPYSRLAVDCNRPLESEQLVPQRSEDTDIPGNRGLDPAARAARVAAIHTPYHAAIAALLDRRAAAGRASLLVAVHSFTPVYRGERRPWHAAVLYGSDTRLAHAVLAALAPLPELCVGDNQPYRIDEQDYGVPVHGIARGLPNVLLEIRQDEVADAAAQAAWAERLATVLEHARRATG